MDSTSIDYRLKVSPRGRNIRLRVSVKHGLEVIIPRGYDAEKVPSILQRKKSWIHSALERAEAQRKFFEPEPAWKLPSQITLAAIGKTWHVAAKPTRRPSVVVRELSENSLLVLGAVDDERNCRDALTRWLMRKTREYLVPRLRELGQRTELRFARTFVKRPRTRWASCSRHKSISLNAKLLFLPSELVDYVLIHELCHLAELNHTARFWSLVQHHCPHFRTLDERIREMWKTIPRWAYR
jgi:predicted metal-dependent hydrolase